MTIPAFSLSSRTHTSFSKGSPHTHTHNYTHRHLLLDSILWMSTKTFSVCKWLRLKECQPVCDFVLPSVLSQAVRSERQRARERLTVGLKHSTANTTKSGFGAGWSLGTPVCVCSRVCITTALQAGSATLATWGKRRKRERRAWNSGVFSHQWRGRRNREQ